jgi:hypothetical protein
MNFKIFTPISLGLILASTLVVIESCPVQAIFQCKGRFCSKTYYGTRTADGRLPAAEVARLEKLVRLGQATYDQRLQLRNHYKAVEQIRSNPTQNINRGIEINKVK